MKKVVMTNKTCIIITGPTASGKTSLAIDLAEHFGTQIISADSRQCFNELNIGVAKPSDEQLYRVKHHFINSHSIEEEVNAVVFEKYALTVAEELFREKETVIMAGGTGLYIKAFCEGMDDIPPVDPSIRQRINDQYQEKGISWLQEQISTADPLFYKKGEIQNPHRVIRALEVALTSGSSILSFQNQGKKQRPFDIIKIGVELPRQELYNNINLRVDEMLRHGLVEEVRSLLPFQQYNALQTVGYKELFDFFNGKVSEEEAVAAIKQNTRHYAKRQLTWFKKDETIRWVSPYDKTSLLDFIIP